MSSDQTASIDSITIIVKITRLVVPALVHQTTMVANPIVVNK